MRHGAGDGDGAEEGAATQEACTREQCRRGSHSTSQHTAQCTTKRDKQAAPAVCRCRRTEARDAPVTPAMDSSDGMTLAVKSLRRVASDTHTWRVVSASASTAPSKPAASTADTRSAGVAQPVTAARALGKSRCTAARSEAWRSNTRHTHARPITVVLTHKHRAKRAPRHHADEAVPPHLARRAQRREP